MRDFILFAQELKKEIRKKAYIENREMMKEVFDPPTLTWMINEETYC